MLYYIFVFSILLVIVLSAAYVSFVSDKLKWWKRAVSFLITLFWLVRAWYNSIDYYFPDSTSTSYMLILVAGSVGLVLSHRYWLKTKNKLAFVPMTLSAVACLCTPMLMYKYYPNDYYFVYSEAQTSDYNYYASDTVAMPEYYEESATVDYIPADTVSVAEDYETPAAAPVTESAPVAQEVPIDTLTSVQSSESESQTPAAQAPREDQVFDAVEQAPQFPGGEEALLRFVANNIRYPALAIEYGHQGTVVVRFVVTHTGDVGKVVIARGKTPELDKEAVRVVKKLPKFTPGKQNGHAVNVWYTLPIRFKLQE